MTNLPHISASKLSTFKTCHYLYKRQYIDRILGTENPSAIMGSAVHKAIEMHYKNGSNVREVYQAEMHRRISEATEHGRVKYFSTWSEATKACYECLDLFKWTELKQIELELKFSLPFPRDNPIAIIDGVIDMVTNDGRVIDHKSSKTKPTKKELANNMQFLIYAWAYAELYGTLPTGVYWNHLREGKLTRAEVLDDYEQKLAHLHTAITAVLAEREYAKRTKDGFCMKVCALYQECYP